MLKASWHFSWIVSKVSADLTTVKNRRYAEGGMAYEFEVVWLMHMEEVWPLCPFILVNEVWPLCASVSVKEVWPLCNSVSVKEVWPLCLSWCCTLWACQTSCRRCGLCFCQSHEGGLVFVSPEWSVACISGSSSEGGMAFVSISLSKEGVDFVKVVWLLCPSVLLKEAWPLGLSSPI